VVEIRINKIEAAQRQIDAAIRMLYRGEDPVAVHSVISAANGIVRAICKANNTTSWVDLLALIKRGMEKEYWNGFLRMANFIKHADKDPEGVLEGVQEEVNDWVILYTIFLYNDLAALTPTMSAHLAWMEGFYPDIRTNWQEVHDKNPGLYRKILLAHPQFQSMNRQQRLEEGMEILKLSNRIYYTGA
jgi:hypothetical protein